MDVAVVRPHRFDGWKVGALLRDRHAHTAFLPRFISLRPGSVVQFAAAAHDNFHRPLLFRSA
jgi:hypothetical protein